MNARLLAGIISVALAVIPLAPQEHVHETRSRGELQVVIHRHIEAHGSLRHQAAPNLASLDDDHDPILTLTPVYTVPAPPVVALPSTHCPPVVIEPPPSKFERRAIDVERLTHSPPRAPTPLRGPPLLPTS